MLDFFFFKDLSYLIDFKKNTSKKIKYKLQYEYYYLNIWYTRPNKVIIRKLKKPKPSRVIAWISILCMCKIQVEVLNVFI